MSWSRPRPASAEDVRRAAETGDLIFAFWSQYGRFPSEQELREFRKTCHIPLKQ